MEEVRRNLLNRNDECLFPGIETASRNHLKEIQLKKLRRVVRLAYNTSPFYHARFKSAGISPEDIRTFKDYSSKVPLTTKNDLRLAIRESGDFTSGITSFAKDSIANTTLTSGTTGENTFVAFTKHYLNRFIQSVAMREYWMAKIRPDTRVFLSVSGWHFFALAQNLTLSRLNVECISPWGTNFPRFTSRFAEAVIATKPDYVITIPWMLSAMIEEYVRKDIEPKRAFDSVKYVSVAGEALSPRSRESLQNELCVEDIFESAGSVDGMWGGSDCFAHRGHHIWMDANYIEILDTKTGEAIEDTKDGEERGTIVSTNLVPGASLFLRFDCEDLGSIFTEICECGRTHCRVEIFDRLSNMVEICGRQISSYDIMLCFEQLKETQRSNFTLVKYSPNMEVLKIRASLDYPIENVEKITDALRNEINEKLGVPSEIEWVPLERLPVVGRKVQRVTGKGM
jgi:phenylacetate-CoA ligase